MKTKLFLILCLLGILVLGIFWNVFSGSFSSFFQKEPVSYETFLSGALARNTPEKQLLSVSFFQNDFLGLSGSKNARKESSRAISDRSYFRASEFNQKQAQLAAASDISETRFSGKNISLPQTDFGKLSGNTDKSLSLLGGSLKNGNNTASSGISGMSMSLGSANCEGGILYDPCIDPLDPFIIGSDEDLYLGITPIYREPKESVGAL